MRSGGVPSPDLECIGRAYGTNTQVPRMCSVLWNGFVVLATQSLSQTEEESVNDIQGTADRLMNAYATKVSIDRSQPPIRGCRWTTPTPSNSHRSSGGAGSRPLDRLDVPSGRCPDRRRPVLATTHGAGDRSRARQALGWSRPDDGRHRRMRWTTCCPSWRSSTRGSTIGRSNLLTRSPTTPPAEASSWAPGRCPSKPWTCDSPAVCCAATGTSSRPVHRRGSGITA